jgi:integrating conjugative element protein (TIGR03761 family)
MSDDVKQVSVKFDKGEIVFRSIYEGFHKEQNSPFEDGYDLFKEQVEVQRLIDAGLNKNDAAYGRVLELNNREDTLLRSCMNKVGKRKDKNVRLSDFKVIVSTVNNDLPAMGKLVTQTQDTILIHTLQAARIFQGMLKDSKKVGYPGVVSASIAMTRIYEASSGDNPFVEWTLIQSETRLANIDAKMNQYVQEVSEKVESAKKSGLNISIPVSEQPATYSINFGSPYGYLLARLVLNFDTFVRSIKGLQMRTLISRDVAEKTINDVRRELLSTFNEIINNKKVIANAMVREVKRSYWLDPSKREELAAICNVLGVIPNDVLTKDKKPDNGRGFIGTSLTSDITEKLVEVNNALAEKVNEGA